MVQLPCRGLSGFGVRSTYVYIAYFHLDTSFRSFRMELAIGLHILHVKHLRAAFGSDRERPRAAAQQHTKLRAARVPTKPENYDHG